jgi:hypothetical protein
VLVLCVYIVVNNMYFFDSRMGEKAEWNVAHMRLFCELCAAEVFAGNRPLGHLNKVSWKNVEAKFFEKSGQKLEHLQLKNK